MGAGAAFAAEGCHAEEVLGLGCEGAALVVAVKVFGCTLPLGRIVIN
jgi:hypothetical protein